MLKTYGIWWKNLTYVNWSPRGKGKGLWEKQNLKRYWSTMTPNWWKPSRHKIQEKLQALNWINKFKKYVWHGKTTENQKIILKVSEKRYFLQINNNKTNI